MSELYEYLNTEPFGLLDAINGGYEIEYKFFELIFGEATWQFQN